MKYFFAYILFLLSIFFVSCSQQPVIIQQKDEKIVTKIDTIKIVRPAIEKFIYVTKQDTSEVIAKDSNTTIKYYPLLKKFYIYHKPDTVRMLKIDTVKITQIKNDYKEKKEFTFDSIQKYFLAFVALIAILYIIKLYKELIK